METLIKHLKNSNGNFTDLGTMFDEWSDTNFYSEIRNYIDCNLSFQFYSYELRNNKYKIDNIEILNNLLHMYEGKIDVKEINATIEICKISDKKNNNYLHGIEAIKQAMLNDLKGNKKRIKKINYLIENKIKQLNRIKVF